jgi:hypothetical protein
VFFDDIWRNNKDVFKELRTPAAEALMNPSHPGAIAYSPAPREALEKQLAGVNLIHRSKLFSPSTLDCLYDQMAAIEKQYSVSEPTVINVASQPSDVYSKAGSAV